MKTNPQVYHHPLMRTMRQSISRYQLLEPHASVLVALSGGADSVALLLALQITEYHPIAIHCNFHLRGEESLRDEQFCRNLTAQLGIELEVHHFDTRAYATTHGLSVEMAARDLRYQVFEQEATKRGIEAIAVAHHLQDNVETLLGNLSRGTGLTGLRGILPKRGSIIRPLLDVHPKEIHDFLHLLRQPFCNDSTNQDTSIKRNAIRHRIIPLFQELNPQFLTTSRSTLAHLRDAETIYQKGIEALLTEARVPQPFPLSHTSISTYKVENLLRSGVAPTLLHYITEGKGFSADAIEQFEAQLSSPHPVSITANNYTLECRKGLLHLISKPLRENEGAVEYLRIDSNQGEISTSYGIFSYSIHEKNEAIPTSPLSIVLDWDALSLHCSDAKGEVTLSISAIDPEEKIQPFRLKGRKTIHKILNEKGIVPVLFSSIPLLRAGEQPLWIVPIQRTEAFAITPNTRRYLQLSFSPIKE
ncbi:MAG: tRNA lysidine(34) synthetase TilS [Porphyromonas endodontalis]|uniref:tRNA lysidine(34) synthetase TilS n=1 Tax=Porphyromonas endodontalis TaxID=28124 RepID=UPI003F9F346B